MKHQPGKKKDGQASTQNNEDPFVQHQIKTPAFYSITATDATWSVLLLFCCLGVVAEDLAFLPGPVLNCLCERIGGAHLPNSQSQGTCLASSEWQNAAAAPFIARCCIVLRWSPGADGRVFVALLTIRVVSRGRGLPCSGVTSVVDLTYKMNASMRKRGLSESPELYA